MRGPVSNLIHNPPLQSGIPGRGISSPGSFFGGYRKHQVIIGSSTRKNRLALMHNTPLLTSNNLMNYHKNEILMALSFLGKRVRVPPPPRNFTVAGCPLPLREEFPGTGEYQLAPVI